ncbi:MAG TPA: RedB protein [Candidatus Binatia bacterium]
MSRRSTITNRLRVLGVTPRIVLFAGLWLASVSVGMASLASYDTRPGPNAEPPLQWPSASSIEPVPGRPTLVVLAHPKCPCTRATVAEVAVLMTAFRRRVDVHILFELPAGAPDGWEQTDIWRSAAAIPGVDVGIDADGVEAARFHAITSGQTILYDAAGNLRFTGGITAARGEQGGNLGLDAVAEAIIRPKGAATSAPVYGCLFRREQNS